MVIYNFDFVHTQLLYFYILSGADKSMKLALALKPLSQCWPYLNQSSILVQHTSAINYFGTVWKSNPIMVKEKNCSPKASMLF